MKENEEANILMFHTRRLRPETAQEIAQVKRLLRLNPEAMDLPITYGADMLGDREIALHTHSGYQVLIEIASLVEVPLEHVAEHRTYGLAPAKPEKIAVLPEIMAIQSGPEQPSNPFAQVRYRGHWYWIDDRDFLTKRVFTFMTVLFTLSETGQKIQQPILTIRAN